MHNANLDADVIVVGLGPTGATTACLLAQRGVRVAAFDQSADIYPKPRAISFDQEFMRVMQELKIAERIMPFTAPYRPSEYLGTDGQVIRRIEAAPPPHLLGWTSNYVFDQPGVERELRKRLLELKLVTASYSTEVMSCGQDADGVWVQARLPDGGMRRFTAKYLLACDGGSSPIRKSLGIMLEDLGFDEPWLVVDAIVPDTKIKELPQTQIQYCDPFRPCTYVVGPGNHRRWEIMLLPGDALSAEFPEAELWPLLARWLKPGEARLWRAATYRFRSLVTHEWRRARILLAGDAAHMTPPFMSQGMVQGIRDGLNLAWKIERVVQGASTDSLLDTYGLERRPHVMATTQAAIGLGREICERDLRRARDRDARLASTKVNERVVPTIRQNLIPGLTMGPLVSNTPAAGTLFPQPFVNTGGRTSPPRLLDELTGPKFRVLISGEWPAPALLRLERVLVPLKGSLIRLTAAASQENDTGPGLVISEASPILMNWLGTFNRPIAIIRPDHYVHGTAGTIEGAIELLGELQRQLN
jgi:3-(3-hydroxy-phenyl)propionate hydroxylase